MRAFLILAALACNSTKEEPKPRDREREAKPKPAVIADAKTEENKPDAEPAAIDVTAEKLVADYKANEIAADNAYKDKVLRVNGEVLAVKKGLIDGEPYVMLPVKRDLWGASAHFRTQDGLASLVKGKRITILCRGDGVIIGGPGLRDCILQ